MPKPHVRRRRRFLVAAALALGRCAASSTLSVAPQPVQPRKRLALEAAPYAVGCAVAGAVTRPRPAEKSPARFYAPFPLADLDVRVAHGDAAAGRAEDEDPVRR